MKTEDSKTGVGEPHSSDSFKQVNAVGTTHEPQKPTLENSDIPTNLIKYYGITCNTILGHSDLKVSCKRNLIHLIGSNSVLLF